MTELARQIAARYGAHASVAIQSRFAPLHNAPLQSEAALAIAQELEGPSIAVIDPQPKSGSEDFADMLVLVPGAYLWLGQGAGAPLHNPCYDFNDEAIPIGASLLARLAEQRTGLTHLSPHLPFSWPSCRNSLEGSRRQNGQVRCSPRRSSEASAKTWRTPMHAWRTSPVASRLAPVVSSSPFMVTWWSRAAYRSGWAT